MKRKTAYVILAAIIALIIFAVWYSYLNLKPSKIVEDFEEGSGSSWFVGADVPEDPNNPGHTVEWNVTRVDDIAHSGQHSLKLFIDGRQDDGTIWIRTNIRVNKNTQTQVKVSFWLYSQQESFNTIAVVCGYIGVPGPRAEEDFTVLGAAN